jgi:TolA-binding protein
MAQTESKDLLSRLADRGEQVLGRISDLPGAQQLMEGLNGVRDRLDEVQKRLRGLDSIERRLTALERRVEELDEGKKPRARAAKTSGPKPKAASPGATRTASALKRSGRGSSPPSRRSGNA